ncbi:MAG: hypothetical protein J2P37_20105 [Ktedonobacteraceae bacterium]|nr:hypothetical protein [Ktedonobacteraceae bacterium]MBO0791915.1 hypothetical protein [Ktedonobacteraceae bacterium]
MIDTMVPCGFLLFLLLFVFLFNCWFLKIRYIYPLEERIRWLEHEVAPPEPVNYRPQPKPTRQPVRPRYVPVERQGQREFSCFTTDDIYVTEDAEV